MQTRLLRQQHDQLIVRHAHDAGYHLSPEKWASLLRTGSGGQSDSGAGADGAEKRREPKAPQPHSEMQSVVDKVCTRLLLCIVQIVNSLTMILRICTVQLILI